MDEIQNPNPKLQSRRASERRPGTGPIRPDGRSAPGSRWSLLTARLAPLAWIVPAILALPVLFYYQTGQHALLAIGLSGIFVFLLIHSPRAGIASVLVYLALVGGLRRWLSPFIGTAKLDPLLLVSPALVGFYMVILILKRHVPRDTRLARLLFWLLAIMILETANPIQGSLTVGAAGALFYIVPLLWYYVGRNFGSARVLRNLYTTVIAVAVAAAFYGYHQVVFGFSAAETEWIKTSDYAALQVNGHIHPFSFFTSSAEYAAFVALGITLLWALFLRGTHVAALAIPPLAVALFLVGSRGPVVMTLFAGGILWAVQGRSFRSWMPRLCLALVIAAAGMVWSLKQVKQEDYSENTQGLVEHQTEGLLHPLDEKSSTVALHSGLALGGIAAGFTSPLGRGLGVTTLAAAKFGDGGGGTEADISNMFTSLGCVGGFLYLAVIGWTLLMALRTWHRERTMVPLGILGILALTLSQWLNGGYYAASMLTWFCIGALDRLHAHLAEGNTP